MNKITLEEYTKNGADITISDNSTFDYILGKMIDAVAIPYEDFESVKLYADGNFMLEFLKYIILNDGKYGLIKLCMIDVIASGIDFAVTDEYVLALDSNLNVYIQNVWNGDRPFLNEAKFTIVTCDCSEDVMHNIFLDETPIMVICP